MNYFLRDGDTRLKALNKMADELLEKESDFIAPSSPSDVGATFPIVRPPSHGRTSN